MKVKFFPTVISAVILTVALTACQGLEVSTDTSLDRKISEMYLPTVVVLTEDGSLGSGVIVDRVGDDYLVLSAWHVVTSDPVVRIALIKGSNISYPGVVLRTSESQDLALIRVRMKEDRPASKLCVNEPKMFEEVFAVGAGLTEQIFPTVGIISNARYYFEDYPEVRYLHHSAPIAPGNSGGPLYKLENGSYCITGINLRGRSTYSQFGYASHLFELYSFLRNTTSAKSN